jgi:cell division protease FtsH
MAKQMVMRFGMSEKLGARTLGHNQDQPFLGREFRQEPDYSEEIAREIDDEIRRIVEQGREQAMAVLREHREQLDRVAEILIRRETLDRSEFEALLEGVPEKDVFHDKDARTQRRAKPPQARERQDRARQPKIVAPAPIKPVDPETT